MTPDEVFRAFEQNGSTPVTNVPIYLDKQTLGATGHSIRADSLFALLGFTRTLAVDVSDFEGAELVVDLNRPIEKELAGICDFLFDGSVLDNIFDPVTGLRNAARMVRPGGRLLFTNAGNYSTRFNAIPYLIFTGVWFYDYFAINNFSDLQVFVTCAHPQGQSEYMLDHDNMTREFGKGLVRPMVSLDAMAINVFAEKGQESTWDQVPTQHVYRSPVEWGRFEHSVERYKASPRSPFLRSSYDKIAAEYTPGWVFIDSVGQIRRPYHEDISDLRP